MTILIGGFLLLMLCGLPVAVAMFMRLPARMKNGTASSGKLSTPAIMRCASVTSGVMPVTRI